MMTSRLPPVPPASRSPKRPGDQVEPLTSKDGGRADRAPENLEEEGRQGNVKHRSPDRSHGDPGSSRQDVTQPTPEAAKEIGTTEVRQGRTPHIVRYVLAISLTGAVVALAVVWVVMMN